MALKPDPELVAVLCAGLEAMSFIETCARGDWRRFAKFGRAGAEGEAYYVKPDGSVWFSAIRFTEPDFEVKGPLLDRIFDTGCKAEQALPADQARRTRFTQQRGRRIDPDAALKELIGGSDAEH